MSALDQQIINVTRTAIAAYLQTIKYLGLKFTMIDHTTLNEKFGIQNGVKPPLGVVPNVRYMVIGNKGHYTVVAADGSDETVNRVHRANHNALYNQIPFVLREITNDLSAVERQTYRLRRGETYNNVQYFAYYARVIDVGTVAPMLLQIEVINGVPTVTPYTPTADDLNPIPPTISSNGTVVGSNKTISASAIIEVKLTKDEIAEITNAHRIRTGSTRSPVISEIGLCSGVDAKVSASSGAGPSIMIDEVLACQVNVHIATNHPVGYNSNGLTLTFDVGGVEPTLGDTALNVAQFV